MTKTTEKSKYNYIDVDVAKAKLDIALDKQHVITIDNTVKAFKGLLTRLDKLEKTCFVMEASGGYERDFIDFIHTRSIAVLSMPNMHVASLIMLVYI